MVMSMDRPAMTIAVDLGCKATKQTNNFMRFGIVAKIHSRLSLKIYFFKF